MLESLLQENLFLLLSLIAFIAGFVDGVAGGGGLILIPSLLMAGIPPHMALGTNKLAATLGIFNAALTYLRYKIFEPRYWIATIIAVLIGALVGTLATQLFSSAALEKLIPIILILVAVYLLWPQRPQTIKRRPNLKPKKLFSAITGSALGFYDGFCGPGTGSFWVIIVKAVYKVDLVQASAIAKLMNFVSNFVALIVFMLLNNVHYSLGLTMGVVLMLGSYLGVRSAIRFGEKFIRPMLLTVVLIMASHLAWINWIR